MTGGQSFEKESARVLFEAISITFFIPPLLFLRLVNCAVGCELSEYGLLRRVLIILKSDVLSASESEDLQAVLSEGPSFIKHH